MSFATHLPFPSPTSALPQTQVSSSPSTPTPTRGCCENGRPVLTDPTTGQSVCSCQYSSALLGYSRLPGLSGSLFSPSSYSPGAPPAPAGYGVGLGAEGSAFYSPLSGGTTNLRDSADAWRSLTQSTLYDTSPMGFYPYGGYGGLDLNARRKNATRESTNTLKAWLHEHIKNPYPTKGEKIMLAIITKMTLTQVSTWFANARRRLKKENKMTWSPRNRSEDGDDDDDDDEGGVAGGDEAAKGGGGGGGGGGAEKDQQEKEKRLNNGHGEDIDVGGNTNTNTNKCPPHNRPTTKSLHMAGSDSVSPTPSIAEDARGRLSPRDTDPGYPPALDGTTHHHGHHHHGHHHQSGDLDGDQQKPKIWSVTDFLHPGAAAAAGAGSNSSSSSNNNNKTPTEPSSCKETGMKMDTMRCVPTSAEAAAAAAAAAAVDLTGRTVVTNVTSAARKRKRMRTRTRPPCRLVEEGPGSFRP
ncbi:uncharacterized protein LOC143285401 [Babylonia areolata]|uniref:uncharacterized protein LOC143285401 n=1 Tax=Babylonia areolata TaxID=304850 RepID=UPI003FD43B0C